MSWECPGFLDNNYYHAYLAEETVLSWLTELLAEDNVDPVLLAVGEGGGGKPA